MEIHLTKNRWKWLLIMGAIGISTLTLLYTNSLVSELRDVEEKKIKLYAEATKLLTEVDLDEELNILFSIIQSNTTIPVILTNEQGQIISTRNLHPELSKDTVYLEKQLEIMRAQHEVIEISDKGVTTYVHYKDSILLTKLQYYPLIMLLIIALFMVIAYGVFSSFRRSEQNLVWAGMAKETAHQIGTPLSSLMGWAEILKSHNIDALIVDEIEKDIQRLETIAQRFSKIGSQPEISRHNLIKVTEKSMRYLKNRSSSKINFSFGVPKGMEELRLPLNIQLYEWVIENLIRNAIDAMDGQGSVEVKITDFPKTVHIEVSDTGKGIPRQQHKTVFKPGYTTKTRGWGLGLSLAKRIIEEYHKGKIYVCKSEPGKGTTIRIILKKHPVFRRR